MPALSHKRFAAFIESTNAPTPLPFVAERATYWGGGYFGGHGATGVPWTAAIATPPAVDLTPQITSISPNHGPVTGGTDITIRGANFTESTTVSIDSRPAQVFPIDGTTLVGDGAGRHRAGQRRRERDQQRLPAGHGPERLHLRSGRPAPARRHDPRVRRQPDRRRHLVLRRAGLRRDDDAAIRSASRRCCAAGFRRRPPRCRARARRASARRRTAATARRAAIACPARSPPSTIWW